MSLQPRCKRPSVVGSLQCQAVFLVFICSAWICSLNDLAQARLVPCSNDADDADVCLHLYAEFLRTGSCAVVLLVFRLGTGIG